MKFTEFKTSALLIMLLAGILLTFATFWSDIPDADLVVIWVAYVATSGGIAKDLITSPAGASELYKLAIRALGDKSEDNETS